MPPEMIAARPIWAEHITLRGGILGTVKPAQSLRRYFGHSIFEPLERRWHLTADVHFSIDVAQNVHAISRFIYGVNQSLSGDYANLTLTRSGGNRLTAYNWENNA